ncbi:unnamed protein product [Symbiodinium pilosum]|uniref:Uncharacterized protein n=1 Tax=Symbiodinium pilosum TaxID=2952 RepID=A0A812TKN7_SYMPI|nr:unnamed protein product [Symbiodinium pilosum]
MPQSLRAADETFSAAVALLDQEKIAPLLGVLQSVACAADPVEEEDEEVYRACPQHGMHSLKAAGSCTFVSQISGVVPGQTWLWADDEETVAAFDDVAGTLLNRLPLHLQDQLMLYTASFTIVEENVYEDDSKWHVDWHGIPKGLSWTILVPLWPLDDKDWRNLGGTQLCVNEHMLPRPKAVASCSAAAAEAVAKEAAMQFPDLCARQWATASFSVLEHGYRWGECLLFEGHVLHRTGPYQATAAACEDNRMKLSCFVSWTSQQEGCWLL